MRKKRSALKARRRRDRARRQAASRRRLRCEPLEGRVLLDASGLFPPGLDPTLPPLPGPFPPPPPLEPGAIAGRVWEDANGNRSFDSDELGMAGVTVYSDLNFNGILDPFEPHAVTTADIPETDFDEGGFYRLDGLHPGYHTIRQITPDGFEQTYPSLPDGYLPPPWGDPSVHVEFVDAGAVVEGVDFGNKQVEPGSVHGVKFEDANGNAARDPGELGLPGVVIYSDENLNGVLDADEPHTVTMEDDPDTDFDESGMYWLEDLDPGWNWIREVVPEGYQQTLPLFGQPYDVFVTSGQAIEGIDFGNQRIVPGSVHGLKFDDANGNAVRDQGESGLPGVIIYSDRNLNGVLDPDEPQTVTMEDDQSTDFDESGLYWLDNLDPGWHWIKEIVPEGWHQTLPLFGRPYDVFILPGQTIEAVDFGNRRIEPGSVHGVKWDDANGNAVRDPDELGVPGVIIFSDQNLNGVFDVDEPHTVTMEDDPNTDFDESGQYWLENLDPGWHWIKEVIPDGYRQTFPNFTLFGPEGNLADGGLFAPPLPGGTPHDVYINPGETIDGIDFGNQRIVPGSIHGVKWEDVNGNAEFDPDERGLAGVTIYSDLNFNGVLDADEPHAVTMADDPATDFDEGGRYWLDVDPGLHVVREIVPDGYRQTFPFGPFPLPEPPFADIAILPPLEDGVHYVTVEPGQAVENIDFGNQPIVPGTVRGVKWEDINGNAEFDPHERGLPGVTIYVDLNNNGFLESDEPQAVTMRDNPDTDFDEAGRYEITGLDAGDYVIREVVPNGFVQTYPLVDPPIPAPLPEPPGTAPGDGVHDDGIGEFATVEPDRLDFDLLPGEVQIVDVAITVHPAIFVPIEIDVLASPPDIPVLSLNGPQPNGGSGETSVFQLMVLGEGFGYEGEIQFLDLAGGNVLASIPISVNAQPPNDGAHRITLRQGETIEGIDFGNQRVGSGVVAGRKWTDLNGNGEHDLDEPGLAGVTIYADHNLNGRLDANEPSVVTAADDPVTDFDESGFYQLETQVGFQAIREVVPGGFRQTFPISDAASPLEQGAHYVNIEPGDFIDGLDFGNQPIETGSASVSGVKWDDANYDGQRNGSEQGVGGIIVYSDLDFNGQWDADEPHTETTFDIPETDFDEGGLYTLGDLAPGLHLIREVVPPGFVQTFPSTILGIPHPDAHIVVLAAGDAIDGLDFGNALDFIDPLPGDFNGDGLVNGADLDVWHGEFGDQPRKAVDGAEPASGRMSGFNLLTWQRNARPLPPVDGAGAAVGLPPVNLDGSSVGAPQVTAEVSAEARRQAAEEVMAEASGGSLWDLLDQLGAALNAADETTISSERDASTPASEASLTTSAIDAALESAFGT